MDIQSRFEQLQKSSELGRMNQSELLQMYTDLCLNLSPEIADHIVTVAGSSAVRFKKIQNKMLSNRWPEQCFSDFLKLSESGLELLIKFTIRYPNDSLDWLPSIVRIIGELSDEEISEVEVIMYRINTKLSSVEMYDDRFYNYVRLYGSERPLIAAIITTRYGEETLEVADSILTNEFDADDLSVMKLTSVCEFIENGGSTDTPVQWMFELSES